MYPSGVIYNANNPKQSGPHGEVFLHASRAVKALYTLFRGVGAGVVGFVIIALLFTFGPLIKEEINFNLGADKIDIPVTSVQDSINAQNTSAVQAEAQSYGLSSYYSIVIPDIGAKANIIANVDPSNEKEYDDALSKGVAHAKGTYFPGQGKTIYLFAHSTNSPFNVARYNAVFYLLDKEKQNDKIIVYFADKKYTYQVTTTKIIGPSDISFLNYDDGSETLILQTCYPPGTSWNRLLVFAKRVDN